MKLPSCFNFKQIFHFSPFGKSKSQRPGVRELVHNKHNTAITISLLYCKYKYYKYKLWVVELVSFGCVMMYVCCVIVL